ncbi:Hypothetical predicted protein [Podarcis lilfordi]|nr:Hypothetical predicted protein [Podarcis lilfordi]
MVWQLERRAETEGHRSMQPLLNYGIKRLKELQRVALSMTLPCRKNLPRLRFLYLHVTHKTALSCKGNSPQWPCSASSFIAFGWLECVLAWIENREVGMYMKKALPFPWLECKLLY